MIQAGRINGARVLRRGGEREKGWSRMAGQLQREGGALVWRVTSERARGGVRDYVGAQATIGILTFPFKGEPLQNFLEEDLA